MHYENYQIVKHFKEYFPSMSLNEGNVKNNVIYVDTEGFRFRIESFGDYYWVYFDSKEKRAETFPEACKIAREFLEQEKIAIALNQSH